MNPRVFKGQKHKLLVSVVMVIFLASCTLYNHPEKLLYGNLQPGNQIQNYLSGSETSSDQELIAILTKVKANKKTKALIEKHTENIVTLYKTNTLNLIQHNYDQNSLLAENVNSITDLSSVVSTLVSLYPIDAYRLLSYFNANNVIDHDQLIAIAVNNNLDPSIVLSATASGYENTVTPLINSAGIVIYGQDEGSSSDVKYREASTDEWQAGLSLAWEPIYGALSGSIVHLNADTAYEIVVEVTNYDGYKEEYSFSFQTRPNSPPIDSNKIYYLSEIYSGGQLDLEALNIFGSEDGYAKIIGDGQVIEASNDYLAAVNIGSQAYIMLENLTIRGGERYGIFAENTHDIWIKGCDISEYGRVATVYKDGKGYASESSSSPINYDSGIYLEKTGVSVIEECDIHSPNGKANHWGDGHPNGPNALQVWAYHPDTEFRGQMIVRNNRFFGEDNHRFNDVIEGRKNFYRTGGFVRDSAIYGNYLAYANDDLIEIDGGQRNVLVYENELTEGYAGVSIAPNMLGPSYLFHNHIHDLGDERGKEWTAIKAGGLIAKPGGQTFIFENYINVNRNGLASSGVNGDATYWVATQNNVVVSAQYNNLVGLGIYDKYKYHASSFTNDLIFNKKIKAPFLDISYENYLPHPQTEDSDYANDIQLQTPYTLVVNDDFLIANFSRVTTQTQARDNWEFNPSNFVFSPFHDQTKYGAISPIASTGVSLNGNIWSKIEANLSITSETVLTLELEVQGLPEIVGLAFENDNKVTKSNIIQFYGSQSYGINGKSYLTDENSIIDFPIGEYFQGEYQYLVFILDNDISQSKNESEVTFKNISIEEQTENSNLENDADIKRILVGIGEQ